MNSEMFSDEFGLCYSSEYLCPNDSYVNHKSLHLHLEDLCETIYLIGLQQ